jgi:RNA polymerase sigma-70 factor (ECF subfamily)
MTEASFDEFYRTSLHRVGTFLYAMCGDLAEAQDAAQEAYVRAWQRWATVATYDDPEAWVRTVGHRLLINRWRKASNRLKAHRRHGPDPSAPAPGEDVVALVAALRHLSPEQRLAVTLHQQELARPDGFVVNQRVTAYAAGDAGTAFDRLRAEVVACARIDNQLSGGEITMAILAEGFAGEASMLVNTHAQARGFLHIVVRVGNLISQLSVYPGDEADLRTMAERAVANLCATTRTC